MEASQVLLEVMEIGGGEGFSRRTPPPNLSITPLFLVTSIVINALRFEHGTLEIMYGNDDDKLCAH